MRLWVDADACPGAVKEILIRAALKRGVPAVFVSDKHVMLPVSPLLSFMPVIRGPDAADGYIVNQAVAGDLAVTQDIPLAALLVAKGVAAIDPRGDLHTPETIGSRLALRNHMDALRGSGIVTGGPAPFQQRDSQRFANTLDRELTRRLRR